MIYVFRTESPVPSKELDEDAIICVEDSLGEIPNLKTEQENEEIEVVLSDSGSSSDKRDPGQTGNSEHPDSAEKESLQLTFEEVVFNVKFF